MVHWRIDFLGRVITAWTGVPRDYPNGRLTHSTSQRVGPPRAAPEHQSARGSPWRWQCSRRPRRRGSFAALPLFDSGDLTHDCGLDFGVFVDADVRNGRIVGQIEVDQLAVKAGLGFQRLPPSGRLIVIDRFDDIRGDTILHERRESYQKIDGDVGWLERPRHVDDIVGPLRMTYQNQGTRAAGGALTENFGYFVLPTQMPGHLRIDTEPLELVRECIKPRRK